VPLSRCNSNRRCEGY